MNTPLQHIPLSKTLIGAAVASALLAACTAAPVKPPGAAQARSKLTQLQTDPNLASRAPVAIKEADTAVRAAETPQTDKALAAHRVYLADRKVETARALAETRYAEDQRTALSERRESARLDARTREADAAHRAAGSSAQQAVELQRQLDELQAKPTDRGLVLTLGDVLFTSGQADLKRGATGNLNKLVAFLNQYPDRSVMIEGYTDSLGSEDYNRGLSERRADSVKSYLVGQGVGAVRLTALGKGESEPVADNASAAGRQQNRRVEVIISSPSAALR
jgi:outer membrane protein OmpA-like peptidoglycan-associated protein